MKEKIKFTIRLMNLNLVQFNLIKNQFNDSEELIQEKAEEKSISIPNLNNEKKITKLIEKIGEIGLDEKNINIFISFTSINDISGFTIPLSIIKILKKFGGSIDVSIIFIGD